MLPLFEGFLVQIILVAAIFFFGSKYKKGPKAPQCLPVVAGIGMAFLAVLTIANYPNFFGMKFSFTVTMLAYIITKSLNIVLFVLTVLIVVAQASLFLIRRLQDSHV